MGMGLRPGTCIARGCFEGASGPGPMWPEWALGTPGPGTPAGLLGPKHAREILATFPSDPMIPQRSLSIPADPLTVSGPF